MGAVVASCLSRLCSDLRIRVRCRGDDYTIEVDGAVAVANTIACLSELLDPISIFLGLATGMLRFLK